MCTGNCCLSEGVGGSNLVVEHGGMEMEKLFEVFDMYACAYKKESAIMDVSREFNRMFYNQLHINEI